MSTTAVAAERVTDDGEIVTNLTIGADTAGLTAIVRAELDTQIVTARQFPRNLKRVIGNITTLATLDEETADECMYALVRKKKGNRQDDEENKPIEGPSIRLAEIAAQCYGNCRIEARVIQVNRFEKYVESEGTFHDLETNTATKATVRRRISTKTGHVFGDDMINVTANAACAIAKRNAILAGIPRGLYRPAYTAARAIVAGTAETLVDKRVKAISAFAHFGVKPEQIFEVLGVNGEIEITVDHIATLRGMFQALKNGEASVEEMFPRQPVPSDRPKNLQEAMDKLATGAGDAATDQVETKNQESEVMHSADGDGAPTTTKIESVTQPLQPEADVAAGGAGASPAEQGSDTAPTGGSDEPAKTLADYDTELGMAAKSGTAALQAAWSGVPPAMKKSLKAALDRRHKATADAADAAATAGAAAEEKTSDHPSGPDQATADVTQAGDEAQAVPTTPDEYAAYARAWFGAVTDAEPARARWTAEKKLRNGLNLDPDIRDTLKDELEAKIAGMK